MCVCILTFSFLSYLIYFYISFVQDHAVFITMALYYNLKCDKLIPSVPFLLLFMIALALFGTFIHIWGVFYVSEEVIYNCYSDCNESVICFW